MPVHKCTEAAAQKVKYEWDMLVYVKNRIKKEWETADQAKQNLLLECYLLHARILRDFFTKKRNKISTDDILASDFFDDPSTWHTVSSELCQYMITNKKRVDKKLAHLSYW